MSEKKSTAETKKSSEITRLTPEGIIKSFKRFWWICLILAVIFAGAAYYKSRTSYRPQYKSSVTFTVQTQLGGGYDLGLTSYSFAYNRTTANQLSSTFPNIIKSNILQDVICNDLGLSYFPCSLTASSVSGTNMFTITATGKDPQQTYDVLQSVIKNYPTVAEYVIGNTKLTILTEPEVPTSPSNRFAYRGDVVRAAIVGFAIGMIWVVFYAFMRKTIRTRDDIRKELNQHCIGTLPEVVFKQHKKDIDRSVAITNPLVSENYLVLSETQ